MAKYKTGQQYGRITIIEIYPYDKSMGSQRIGKVFCECSPNNIYEMNIYNLGTGHTKSCGCHAREQAVKNSTVHGMYGTKAYITYSAMLARCYNPNNSSYKYYGARGIKVCDSWKDSFLNFYNDMRNPPNTTYSIDRIDVNGNYEPSNCRWATDKEQSNNKRNNRYIEFNGQVKTLKQWSEEYNIDYHTVFNRLRGGWSIEKSLTEPLIDCNTYYTLDNVTRTHREWADLSGVDEGTLRYRIKKGWELEKAITTPTIDRNTYLTFKDKTLTVKEWSVLTGIPYKRIHARLKSNWTIEDALFKPGRGS